MFSILFHIVYSALVFGIGFGIGRIKNAAKLAAIRAELSLLETKAKSGTGVIAADFKRTVTNIKKHV